MHTIFQSIAAKGLGHGGEMGALRAGLGQALESKNVLEAERAHKSIHTPSTCSLFFFSIQGSTEV